MEYIDAEAQINGCDSSESEFGGWEDFIDCGLEDFIVNEPLVPFGPMPAEYSSEGEGCSTHADVPTGEHGTRQDQTRGHLAAPPIEPAGRPYHIIADGYVCFCKQVYPKGDWPCDTYDEPDFIDE